MRSLIIETSTEKGLIALSLKDKILFTKVLPFGHNQSKYLMSELNAVRLAHNLSADTLDCIAIGIGPGSYTGIRIGVAVAKTLAYSWKLPLIGFSSLETFVPDRGGPFAVLIDAKIGGAYTLKGIKTAEGIHYTSLPEVHSLNELGFFLEEIPYIVSPISGSLKLKLQNLYPNKEWIWEDVFPSPTHITKIISQRYEGKQWSIDGHLDLLYLRKTEAEMERERKSKN